MTGRRTWSGFRAVFSLTLFLQALAVAAVLTVIWPELSWPFPPGSASDRFAAAGVAIAAAVTAVLVTRHSQAYKARRELISAAAARTRGAWLNRDARQSFGVCSRFWPWCRVWVITRIGEDDVRELDEASGKQPLAIEEWVVVPFTAGVARYDGMVLADPRTGKVRDLPGGPGVLRSAWRLSRMAGATGFGLVTASPDQVNEITAQLRAAEQAGRTEPGEQETGDDNEHDGWDQD